MMNLRAINKKKKKKKEPASPTKTKIFRGPKNPKDFLGEQKEVPFEINFKKNQLLIEMGLDMQNRDVDIYANEEFILSAKAGKTGTIKIKKSNNIGRRLMEALSRKEKIRLVV